MKKKFTIIKASGEKEQFSEKKYRRSLRKSGASQATIDKIFEEIQPELHDNMSTKKLYTLTHQLLKKKKKSFAGRYHLKQAMMDFGPTGYPFEHFVGEILKKQNYKVEVNKIIAGRCASEHEVDIVAHQNNEHILIECKFHNRSGFATNIKTALYVRARHDDIQEKKEPQFNQCWLVTNTRFTNLAVQYGECAGIFMLSWSHPKNKSLAHMIDSQGLYPITCLTSLSKKAAKHLLQNNVVLCRDLPEHVNLLKQTGLSPQKINEVLEESKEICAGA